MPLPRRHRRIGQSLLLLFVLANAAFAQGGAWRCDTGQLCREHAPGLCCCPPERHCTTRHASSSSGCCAVATSATVGVAAACIAGRARVPEPVGAYLEPAPHCRCSFTTGASPEAALEPIPLRAASPVAVACWSDLGLPLPLMRAAFIRARRDEPPPALLCLPPLGLRAPPVS